MRRAPTLLAFLLSLALGLPAAAQMMGPPKQLKKLDRMIGHWRGSGTYMDSPWTSFGHVRPVMGGHYLREDLVIEIPAGPQKLHMGSITLYGWNSSTSRYVAYTVSSDGMLLEQDMDFKDDDTLVAWTSAIENGQRNISRWTTTLGDGEMSFTGLQVGTSGPAGDLAKGTMKKVDETFSFDHAKIAPFFGAEVSDAMKRMNRLCGHYKVAGEWRIDAKSDMMSFEGTEKVSSIFGGMIQIQEATGQGYTGFGAIAWNPVTKRYDRFSMNSMGMHHSMTCSFVDDHHLVVNFDGDMMGKTSVVRTVMVTDDDGHITKAWGHSITGAADPFLSYKGTYEITKGKQ